MHTELTKDILENKEKLQPNFKDSGTQKILENAKENWIEYTPKPTESKIVGVDGSENPLKFQGYTVWAVKANAVDQNSKVLFEEHDFGVEIPSKVKEIFDSIRPKLEYQVARSASPNADLVLLDGTLTSRFYFKEKKILEKSEDDIIKTINECENIFYIAKNSTSDETFKGKMADIAFYDHATTSNGFSKLRTDERPYLKEKVGTWNLKKIYYTYVRIPGTRGCFKLELYGSDYTDENVKPIIDKISYNCVKGYPFVLKQAHNKCVIKNSYMRRVQRMAGGGIGAFGAREILNG